MEGITFARGNAQQVKLSDMDSAKPYIIVFPTGEGVMIIKQGPDTLLIGDNSKKQQELFKEETVS